MPEHMEIFDRLKQDHETIRSLMKQMADTTPRDAEKRRDLFAKFRSELVAHSHAESHVFYEPLEKEGETRLDALEGEAEHEVVEHLLDEIDRTDPADDHWTARFQVLQEITEHHLQEEEDEMFEKAREVLSDPEAVSMAERFQKEKQQLKKQL